MSADVSHNNHYQYEPSLSNKADVCVLVGHSIEAITSAVVLASLGQRVHLYADLDILSQQLHQYGFEHHLQALWQMYEQQQMIVNKRYQVVLIGLYRAMKKQTVLIVIISTTTILILSRQQSRYTGYF